MTPNPKTTTTKKPTDKIIYTNVKKVKSRGKLGHTKHFGSALIKSKKSVRRELGW